MRLMRPMQLRAGSCSPTGRASTGARFTAGIAALAVFGLAGAAGAEALDTDPWTPVQFGLAEHFPFQFPFSQDTTVVGARLGIYSVRSTDVTGLDVSALGSLSLGDETGLQVGFYNEVGGDLTGLQLGGLSSDADGSTRGAQLSSIANRAGDVIGGQLSMAFNLAAALTGVQISLVNISDDLTGVQIGLINVNRNGVVPFFPGINVGF